MFERPYILGFDALHNFRPFRQPAFSFTQILKTITFKDDRGPVDQSRIMFKLPLH